MSRISENAYFLEIANLVARRSTCLRRNIGAIAVKDKRIMCTGFNGAPSGIMHCEDRGGCMREKLNIPSGEQQQKCMAIHAEENLIIQAALHGIVIKNSTIYCTHQPCILCVRKLISLKPVSIMYFNSYPDKDSTDLLREIAVYENWLDEYHGKVIHRWKFKGNE